MTGSGKMLFIGSVKEYGLHIRDLFTVLVPGWSCVVIQIWIVILIRDP